MDHRRSDPEGAWFQMVSRYTRRCRYFTGLVHERCLMGLEYKAVLGTRCPAPDDPIPCIGRESASVAHMCQRRRPYSRAEATAMLHKYEAVIRKRRPKYANKKEK